MSDLPEPLTPTDCDLSDFAFMPLDVQRLFTSDTWILGSSDEKVAALTLWARSWHQVPAASLPDNDRILAHLSGAGTAWKRVREHAMRGWVKCSDGRFYHPVVAEKANDAWQKKLFHRERSRKANDARWGKSSVGPVPGGGSNGANEPGDHHGSDTAEPSLVFDGLLLKGVQQGMLEGCLKDSLDDPKGEGQGEREVQGERKNPQQPTAASPPRRRVGCPLPHGWTPSGAGIELAISLGLNVSPVLAKFRDYWPAQPGSKALKTDWEATWRNWCRTEAERIAERAALRMPPKGDLDWAKRRAARLEIELERMAH